MKTSRWKPLWTLCSILCVASFTMITAMAMAQAIEHLRSPSSPDAYINSRAAATDPRVNLAPGLYDAGEAAWGMERIASLPKPPGFASGPGALPDWGSMNTDIAFSGSHLFVGNYDGINIYDIANPARIALISSIFCPGGQGDVSVYDGLLFMSVEGMNGRLDCGAQGFPPPKQSAPIPASQSSLDTQFTLLPSLSSTERMRGIRIFDIHNLSEPRQVADVQTCRGSHTNTLVLDPHDTKDVYLYVSEISNVRPRSELANCVGGEPSIHPATSLFDIDIVKVPLAHPERARVVGSPRIFINFNTGASDGLWQGGDHGPNTQDTESTNGCHDITVFSALGLAAGACMGNGILLDIHDPVHPVRVDAAIDPNFSFWHSATFSNDGTKVLFTDEWGAGQQPHCRATDPMNWGADAIFLLREQKLTLASYYKMPAAQTRLKNCTAHNGSLIPIPGRDTEVQAWYQGGISIVDFTDASHPFEIGYFDRGPVDGERMAMGGEWSAYYYNGYIFGSEIARGVDVFELKPDRYLTQNEIDAASQIHLDHLNVQNQPKIVWPPTPVTARAYIDQLARSQSMPAAAINDLRTVLDATADSSQRRSSRLKEMAHDLELSATRAPTEIDAERMRALARILKIQATR